MRLECAVPLPQRREVDARGAERAAQICVTLAQHGDAPATDRAAERAIRAAPDDPLEQRIELVPQKIVPGVGWPRAARVVKILQRDILRREVIFLLLLFFLLRFRPTSQRRATTRAHAAATRSRAA